jgi:Na+/proline symporter
LAAGITIYAPAIILSTILGWNLNLTNLIIGVLVILYTVSGGTKAVSVTQKQEMAIMMGGMIIALIILFSLLPEEIGVGGAVEIAGRLGKLNLIDTDLDLSNRYTLWSGLLGSFFLAMSYFGTDQSQVQRYLGGKSVSESRLGLLMNAFVKVPMQFLILFIGAMVFVFYQFYQAPVFFNQAEVASVQTEGFQDKYQVAEAEYAQIFEEKRALLLGESENKWNRVEKLTQREKDLKQGIKEQLATAKADANVEDADYVFVSFVLNYLPHGLIGLLLAVIFSAAMSSTAGELNALASTTTVDIYKRNIKPEASDRHYLNSSRLFTLGWGLLALFFASTASQYENLIEFINIIGSLFYGTILGIFMCAFFLKNVNGNHVFIAGLVAQTLIFYLHFFTNEAVQYLWYNPIGCLTVMLLAFLISKVDNK